MDEDSLISNIRIKSKKKNQTQEELIAEAQKNWLIVIAEQGYLYFINKLTRQPQYDYPMIYSPFTQTNECL